MTKARSKGKSVWIADNSSRIRLTGNLRRAQEARHGEYTVTINLPDDTHVEWVVSA